MRGRLAAAVLTAAAVGLASAAHGALLTAKHYVFDVPPIARGGGYQTEAYLYEARSVTIYALLKGEGATQRDAVAGSIAELAKKPHTVVVNGGFSSYSPAAAAGLLMANGRVVNPLSLARNRTTKDLQLSGVLCQRADGRMRILHAEDPAATSAACRSALQAGPLVVEGGRNVIHADEMAKPRYLRTLIGLDSHGRAYVIVFTRPVNLYAAADLLRGASNGGADPKRPKLDIVLNLDGDTSTVLVDHGAVVIGDPTALHPSALVVQ